MFGRNQELKLRGWFSGTDLTEGRRQNETSPLAIDDFPPFPPSRVIAHLHKVEGFSTLFILLSRLVHPSPPFPLFPLCPPGSQYTMNDFRDHFPLCVLLVCTHSNGFRRVLIMIIIIIISFYGDRLHNS